MQKRVYRLLGCSGLARIDFFIDHDEKYLLNEVNPIPGFTPFSMFPKIFSANGYTESDLIDKLIMLALDQYRKKCF